MRTLPRSLEDVSPKWLEEFLSVDYPETRVKQINFTDRSEGTATRLGLDVTFEPGTQNGLPNRMFLKSLLAEQLQVPLSMFRCEVEFYRQMRPELAIETPAVFGCELDEETSHFVVLMEDINARGARFGNATKPYSPEEVASILDSMAEFHARYWQSPLLRNKFSWLESHLEGGNADYFRNVCPALLLQEYELSSYKTAIFDPADYYTPDRLWKALWRLQEIDEGDPPTVLHGDVHVGNTYVVGNGGGGILDWQLMRIGSWAHDVTYIVVTALDPSERRRNEEELVRGYLDRLASKGIAVPDWPEAWERYRQNVVWGILMWLLTPTPLYDRERLEILLSRHRAAAEDLDSFGCLGHG